MLRDSTALAQYLLQGGSIKQALHGKVIDIYVGSQPASADNAPGALKLMRITYQGNAWSADTAQIDKATLTYGSDGDTYAIVINGATYSYTSVAGDDASKVATKLSALVDASIVVSAVANANVIVFRARYAGESYTIANTGTTTPGNNVLANLIANARGNGLHFGTVTGTTLAKEAGAWSGVGIADGLAGWCRVKDAADDDSTSTSWIRRDLAINTANAEMIALQGLNITTGGPNTVTAFSITQPQQ